MIIKKRAFSVVLVLLCVLQMFFTAGIAVNAVTFFEEGDFRFAVNAGDVLMVSGYLGDSKTVELPQEVNGKTVMGIYRRCFENSEIESVLIPASYKTIDAFAFNGCASLLSVDLPESLETIGTMAFYNCAALREVDFSSSCQLRSIGFAAFSDCGSLESICLPDSVADIAENAFCKCVSAETLTLPSELTVIPEYAFYGCTSLKSIAIPDAVTFIGENAFAPMTTEGGLHVFCSSASCAAEYFSEQSAVTMTLTDISLGDVNLDGTLNIMDATLIQQHLAELVKLSAVQLAVADANEDNWLDISDATTIQYRIAV